MSECSANSDFSSNVRVLSDFSSNVRVLSDFSSNVRVLSDFSSNVRWLRDFSKDIFKKILWVRYNDIKQLELKNLNYTLYPN